MSDGAAAASIAEIERRIEVLRERVERCRKAMLVSRIGIWGGGATLIAVLFVADLGRSVVVVLLAMSAIIAGFTWLGANKSTKEEAEAELGAAEAMRADLIGQLALREIGDGAEVLPFRRLN